MSNRPQYIIDIIANDSKLRQQMASWDWEKILGKQGRGIGDALAGDLKDGIDSVTKTFSGLNINWSQVFNTKQIEKIEQAASRILKDRRESIAQMLDTGDTTNLQNTIDGVIKLGQALSSIGSNFDAASLSRGMAALMKVIAPLKNETNDVEAAFSGLFNKVNRQAKSSNLGDAFEISGTIRAAMKELGAADEEIEKASKNLEYYQKLVKGLSGKVRIDPALQNDLAGLTTKLNELIAKEKELAEAGKTRSGAYAQTVKRIMAYEDARLKAGGTPKVDVRGEYLRDEFDYYEEIIENAIKRFTAEIQKLEGKMNSVVGDSFAKTISDQISNIKVKLSLDERSKAAFKQELNTFVNSLNGNDIAKAKVQVDWAFNPTESLNGVVDSNIGSIDNIKKAIEDEIVGLNDSIKELEKEQQKYQDMVDESAYAGKKNPWAEGQVNKVKSRIAEVKELIRTNQHLLDTSDDPTTRQALTSTLKSFQAIQKVIDSKQGALLTKTYDWRKKMIDAMKMEKADVNIQLGFDKGLEASADNLYNYLQAYFEENQLELHINKDAFIQEIKDAVEQGGVSVGSIGGGGTVNLDPDSLKSAIAEGLLAALTGEYTPLGSRNAVTQPIASLADKKHRTVFLDPSSPYTKHMVDAFKAFADYAQGDTRPGEKIRTFFDLKNIDLKSVVDSSPEDVSDMLSQLIEKYGVTLLDDFDNLIKDVGQNRVVKNFRGDLSELLYSQNIGQKTITEEERRIESIKVFQDLVNKSRLLEAFNIKNPKWKTPSDADLNEIFNMATASMDKDSSAYKNAVDSFSALQTIITNEDGLEGEAQRERLQAAIVAFKESIRDTYDTLYNYVSAYDMDVFVKGSKKAYHVSGRSSALRAKNAIGDDDSKIEDVHIYKDISTGVLGVTGRNQERKMMRGYGTKSELIMPYPDRTDILNRDTSINDWRTYEIVEEDIKKTEREMREASEAGNYLLHLSKQMKLQELKKELATFVASPKWETGAAKDAEEREAKSSSLLSEFYEKQRDLHGKKAVVQNTLASQDEEIAEIDAKISEADKAIAEISGDKRVLAGAKKRLANRKVALEAAKRERDLAKDNKEAFDSADTSERDAKIANIASQLRKYKAWQKHPDKYYDDIIEEMYEGQRGSYVTHRDTARKNAKQIQDKLDIENKNVSKYQSWIKDFGPSKDIEEKLEKALKSRDEYARQLEGYQKEATEYDERIKKLQAKILGATDEDRAAFNADFEKWIDGGYDKNGKPIGKLQYWQTERSKLGPDLRSEAEQRLKRAEKAYQKAQQEYDEVATSDEAKNATELDRLEREKAELQKALEEVKASKKLNENKQQQIDNDIKSETTIEKLAVAPQQAEIDELLKDVYELDDKIQQSKREAESIDKFVQDTINGENYKKADYNIKHTKKDQAKIDRQNAYKTRVDYLTRLADDTLADDVKAPENITAAMSKVIDALVTNREAVRVLSQDFGLDKFATDDELRKEINARLTRSADGKNPLPPLIQEFYNKILNEGKDIALKWANDTVDNASKNEESQTNALRKFAQQDQESADKLIPEVQGAQDRLKETFTKQVQTWSDSIREKIALKDSGKLTQKELALVVKEIDELFGLLNKALGDYTKQFRGGEYQYQRNRLISEFKSNKIASEEYHKQMSELEAETSRRLRSELFGDNESLFNRQNEFAYSAHMSRDVDKYTADRTATRADIASKLDVREPVLKARQAELLRDISAAKNAGKAFDELENELNGVNKELAQYAQYHKQVSGANVLSFFQDDAKFLAEYKNELAQIIRMEQQVDLDRAKGASQEDLDRQYGEIDNRRFALNEKMRLGLQSKSTDVLAYMDTLYTKRDSLESQHTLLSNAVAQAVEAGKPTEALERQLSDIAQQMRQTSEAIHQVTEFELNKRRNADTQLDGIAYKADQNVMRVYNEQTQKSIELEQRLAIARAKGDGVENALSASRNQNRKRKNAIERAQEGRQEFADSHSPRVMALKYLTDTEREYTTALEKRAVLNRRMKVKEAQIDDIENDQKYSTSWQYKRHQRVVKDRLVGEYVGSEQYYNDREAGKANVETAMRSYLEKILPTPEDVEKVWYQLERTLDKRGEKIDAANMQEAFESILVDNADYQKFLHERSTEYQKILDAPIGTVDTGVFDLNEAIEAMQISRDALAEGRERIEKEKQANIDFINSVSENEYEPLKQEMSNIKSRVNLDTMVSGFKDVIAQNRNREATINNLKNQVLRAGGNQTEANHLAEQLDNIGDNALKDVDAWAKRFLPEIFWTTEEQFRFQARQNLIAKEETYANKELGELQRSYNQSEKQVRSIFGRETNKMTDVYVSKYMGSWVNSLLGDSNFQASAGELSNDILSTFKNLLEENLFNLVSNYGESLVIKDGMLGGVNIREEIRGMLLRELDILQGRQPEIDKNIAHIEAQRKAAMRYGGIGHNEVADSDVLKEQAVLMGRLTEEKSKQKELTERIAYLEQNGGSEQELGRLNKVLAETNKSIARLQLLADNRDTLLELQHQAKQDEAAAKQWTPEQQKLWLMNKLEVARANLGSEDASVRTQAEQQVARYTELLNNLETKMAADEAERRKDASLIGIMTKALKDAFGGKGGFALDATGVASETTLQKIAESIMRILVVLGGNKLTTVNRDPEMEKKLARIDELKAKRGINVSSGSNNSTRAQQVRDEEPDYIKKAREYATQIKNSADPIADVRNAIVALGKETKGTEDYLIAQLRLQKAINNFTYKNKDVELEGVEWSTYKSGKNKGKQYHTNDAMLAYLEKQDGISKEALDLRLSENKAKDVANAGFTAKVEPKMEPAAVAKEAKKNTDETPVEVVVKPVLDANKKEIVAGTSINDLKAGQKDAYAKYIGQMATSYKVSDTVFADKNALQAKVKELQGVMENSAKDSEEYLKAMVEMSRLIATWRNIVKKTKPEMKDNTEWQKYLTDGEGKLFDKIEDVPLGGISSRSKVTLKQTAMGLGTKLSEGAKNTLFIAKEEAKSAQNKADAKEREVVAEEKITEEKKEQKAVSGSHDGLTKAEQDELAKLENDVKDYSPEATLTDDAEWGGFASENTLKAILELVRKIVTEGVKKSETKSSTKTKKTEADFIQQNALKQDELTRSLIAGKGTLYTQYVGYVDELNQAVVEANKAKKSDKEAAIEKVRSAAKKIDEFNASIVDDLNVQSEFKQKTLELKNRFDDAQKVGYIDADDKNLQAFNSLFTQIQDSNAPDKIEEMRIETVALSDAIQKTINTNKGWMVGNGAKKQLDNQYNKILGARQANGEEFGAKFDGDSTLFVAYNNAYTKLNKNYQEYVDSHKLNDPKIQQQIQQESATVQLLGKRYLSSVQQAEELQRRVDTSGIYKNRKTGEMMELGGTQKVTAIEAQNLRATMLSYVQDGLKQGIIEGEKFDAVNQRLTYTFRTSKDTVAEMVVQYNDATGALYAYQKQEKESLTGLAGFVHSMKGKMKSILQYTTSITSIYRIWGTIKRGVQYVREIDSALTELKKVTDATEKSYDKFLKTAAKTADKVGSTISEIVNSTADWARIGYTLEDAATLAETTAVLLNVSEFQSIDDATKALTSTLQAFSMTADTSMNAVDVLNEIGNNFAISSDGIATALQDSASSLVAANNSYEQAVAMIASANRVVQDPNSVGAALRTISLRLRGTSTKELEEAGEDTDGVITSKSKLRGKIKGYTGIDILTDDGAYKSTYDILLEISKVWDDLTDQDRAGLLELIAGKTRSNTAAAILSNTKDLEAAYKSAMEAEGSALEENKKYLDSIQGRIDLFNNSIQTMWQNTIDSEIVKLIVDAGTGLVKIVDKLGLIQTLVMGLMTYWSVFKKQGRLDFASLLGIHDVEEGWTVGKSGLTGWISKKYNSFKTKKQSKTTSKIVNEFVEQQKEESIATQIGMFDEDQLVQQDINDKMQQIKKAKQELQQIKRMKWDDIIIPDDAIEYKYNNARRGYQRGVLIPNKEAEIAALEKDIEDISKAGQAKIEAERAKLAKGGDVKYRTTTNDGIDGSIAWDLGSTNPQQKSSKYISAFENGLVASRGAKQLSVDYNKLGKELDKIGNMNNEGIVAYMQSLDNLGDEADDTSLALAGYASTVKDGNYSIQGARQYVNQYNQSLKQMSGQAQLAQLKQAALNMAISALVVVITTVIAKIIEYVTKSIKQFEKLSSELSETTSKLEDINSQLDETNEKIKELQEQGSLTFADQEELERLKDQNAELERQKQLTESIQKQQQKGVNESAINAANQYKRSGKTSGKTDGEKIWGATGTGAAIGGTAATVAMVAAGGAGGLGSALMATGAVNGWNPVGWGLLAAGAIVVAAGLIGAAVGTASAIFEENVGDSMDDMRAQYETLKNDYEDAQSKYAKNANNKNYKKMQKASEKLSEYESMMATHFTELDAYYSSIDLSVYDPITDAETIKRLRTEMNDFYDTMDKWAIQSGGQGAKYNAITRIFGENADENLKNIKREIQEAAEAGKDINLSDYFKTADLEEFKARLYEMGIYVYEVEDYFKALADAEKEAAGVSLYDVVLDINKITDGLEGLKSAFNEVVESGSVAASTLVSLNDTFGTLGDAWDNYVNTMYSGTASTKEMTKATEELAKAFIDSKILTGESITATERLTYIIQLENIGVENAEEYVDDKIAENAYKAIQNSATYNEDAVREAWNNASKEDKAKFKNDFDLDYINFADLTADDISKVAEYYGMAKEINADTARQILEDYGVEGDKLEEATALLQDKIDKERELNSLRKKQEKYNEYQDELKQIQEVEDVYNGLVKKYSFITWSKNDSSNFRTAEDTYNAFEGLIAYEGVSKEEFISDYNKYVNLIEQNGALKDLLVRKAEIEDELNNLNLNPEVNQEDIDRLQGEIDSIDEKIKTEITFDVQLNLELQKKSELVDQIKDVYGTLMGAYAEYAEKGYYSVDTLQSLLSLEPKYLTMLYNEKGQLDLNRDAILNVAKARTLDMGIQAAQNIIDQASRALEEGKIDTLKELTEATYGQAEAGWSVVKANLAVLKSNIDIANTDANNPLYGQLDGVYESVEQQVLAIQQLTNSAVNNMSSALYDGANSSLLDATRKKYERDITNKDNQQTYLQNDIDRLQAEDEAVSKSYYEEQIALEEEKLALYEQEREALLGLEMTDEVAAALWEVEHAIQESTMRMVEFRQSIIDLYVDAFDKVVGAYDNSDDFFSDQQNYIDKYQELMELQGGTKTAGGIQEQIGLENKKLNDNIAELNALREAFNLASSAGYYDESGNFIPYLKEGSEEWVEYQDKIRAAEEAILDNKIAIENYREELKQLSVDAFETVREAFSNKDGFLSNQQDYIQGYADLLEAYGVDVPEEVYQKLIDIENQKRQNLVADLTDAEDGLARIGNTLLANAVASNPAMASWTEEQKQAWLFTQQEYVDAYNQMTETEGKIQDCDIATAEWIKTIRELGFEKFERFVSRLDDVNSEMDHMRSLFEDDDVATEDGAWTKDGITSLGLATQQMALAKQKSSEYGAEISALGTTYDEYIENVKATGDAEAETAMSEQEWYDRLQTLKDGQWDAIDAYESAKDAIIDMEEARIDMIEEGLNKEIEAYQELIETKKEELDAERDLYDFKKKVKDQTKDLSELDRRIASLSGSTADADVAELRKLQAERRELQEGLDDTYYQHSKDAQSKALDDELENFQKIREDYIEELRETLEETATVIAEKMVEVLANADVVHEGIQETATEYGTPISNALIAPWVAAKESATVFKNTASESISGLINETGIITLFGSDDTKSQVTSVFTDGTSAANAFASAVTTKVEEIKTAVENSTSPNTANLGSPWTATATEGGPIHTFSETSSKAITDAVQLATEKATSMYDQLSKPWLDMTSEGGALNTFNSGVESALNAAEKRAEEHVRTVNSTYSGIKYPDHTGGEGTGDTGGGGDSSPYSGNFSQQMQDLQWVLVYGFNLPVGKNARGNYSYTADGYWGATTEASLKKAQKTVGASQTGKFDKQTRDRISTYLTQQYNTSSNNEKYAKALRYLPKVAFAKGTLGTDRDQWAITDESWIGEEITLAAGKNGQLQYLKKGSAVMPADISANLVEWGKLNPNAIGLSSAVQGVTLMSNYVNKPELNLSFDALVKASSITQEALPAVKKLVTEELDKFTRKLNYAIKRA